MVLSASHPDNYFIESVLTVDSLRPYYSSHYFKLHFP